MKVQKKYLLLIAGIVWGIAGFNILRIGVMAYSGYLSALNVIISIVVFALFRALIFSKMVRKHTIRIKGYPDEKQFFLRFFDIKAFCIMAFMITFGVGLRMSGICPDVFIAVFYSGLGASLFTAGVLFEINFIKTCTEHQKQNNTQA
ncbi:hypothetical protein [Caproiciproducens sp.]|uniref:hypothetical protein n=1 Tax=Caproiciproducens sp. TaxID=1954376 RepID=UPI0028A07857|nr:hypothetical protein [Caproiciproducens sp.]